MYYDARTIDTIGPRSITTTRFLLLFPLLFSPTFIFSSLAVESRVRDARRELFFSGFLGKRSSNSWCIASLNDSCNSPLHPARPGRGKLMGPSRDVLFKMTDELASNFPPLFRTVIGHILTRDKEPGNL